MNPIVDRCIGTIPAVSSKLVADVFGKDHKNVLRDIRNLIRDLPQEFARGNFEHLKNTRENSLGLVEEMPEYVMTRDGFAILAMGFTGKDALLWKVDFLAAFRALEDKTACEIQDDNARLRNENQTLAHLTKKALPRPKRTLRRMVVELAGDLLGGVSINYKMQSLFDDELAPWQKEVVHLPAMVKQRNTLTKHISDRMKNGIRMFGDAAEGLGLERKDCEDTLREAIVVMCKRHEVE